MDEKLSVFHDRRLDHTGWEYLMLDARYEKIRVGDKVISQAVLVTIGFTVEGKREVLDWRVADSESEESWGQVFRSLKDRGLGSVRLVVSDGVRVVLPGALVGIAGAIAAVALLRHEIAGIGGIDVRALGLAAVTLLIAMAAASALPARRAARMNPTEALRCD